ncbi:MmcQ/YjbR family DNA-binding protein [Zhihengliuella sp.]|uniref:MmcQ/YjbR family DNA-binding protein n=1 Tax=Zhihengliuella sp. TaxID=1954483 RepID=UPI002811A906|nr:MmcQ/YjbR family DNA-binding protein [Zhihengliuella sp.]
MDSAALRRLLLAMPGAFEDQPFGPDTRVYKVRGRSGGRARMFALVWADGTTANLKVDPALGEQLRAAHAAITPGYHMNKRHWVTVDCPALPADMVGDLIEDSYDLVVASLPAADREALGWRRLAGG